MRWQSRSIATFHDSLSRLLPLTSCWIESRYPNTDWRCRRRTSPTALASSCPRGEQILAGTFHATWTAPISSPVPTDEQLDEFLDQLNRAVPSLKLTRDDVRRVHAGLLPAASPRSRSTATRPVIHDHSTGGGPQGLYSISGVKYTTARCVAKQTLQLIEQRHPDWQTDERSISTSTNGSPLA